MSGEHLSMFVNNPTREREATHFTFEGPPGGMVGVWFSFGIGTRYRPALQGADLLGRLRVLHVVGVIGPDGRLESVEHMGLLPFGYEALHVFAQAFYVPASADFPRKVSTIPRRIQLGAGAAVQRLASN